jgi:C4-dicarboxylate-specific signal transduction histidine kinase
VNAHLLHALWLFFNGVLLAARNYSIIQMIKGLMYLLRREKERERRMQRQIFKAKRFRERKRNELERKIEKKKRELRNQQLAERREIDEDYIVMEKKKLEDLDKQR